MYKIRERYAKILFIVCVLCVSGVSNQSETQFVESIKWLAFHQTINLDRYADWTIYWIKFSLPPLSLFLSRTLSRCICFLIAPIFMEICNDFQINCEHNQLVA